MKRNEATPRPDGSKPERHWVPRKFPHLPPLSPTARVLLLVLGWTLIVLGLVGLVLPGLQGVLTLILGAAALSLVSQSMLNALRFLFSPWPNVWRAILRTRRRVHHFLRSRKY